MTRSERDALIESLLPLARRAAIWGARRMPSVEFDELYSDACVGLVRAVDSFDPARGTALEVHVTATAQHEILDAARRRDHLSRRHRRQLTEASVDASAPLSLDQVRAESEAGEGPATLADLLAVDADGITAVEDADEARWVRALVHALPQPQRRVIEWLYLDSLNQVEVARMMQVTPSRVCQIARQAREQLAQEITTLRRADEVA